MHDVGSARLHVQRWHLQTNMPPRSFHCQNYIWRRNKFLKVCVFVSIFWYIYIISFLLIWYFRQLQQIWASNSWGGEQDIHQYRHRRGLCDLITVGIVPWVSKVSLSHCDAWLQVLRINDKDYSITFATYFNVEWFEHRLKVVEELQVSVAQTYLLQKSKSW